MTAGALKYYQSTGQLTLGGNLSDDVKNSIESLKVDRHGKTAQSFMITSGISQHISPCTLYYIDTIGCKLMMSEMRRISDSTRHTATPESPPRLHAKGRWDSASAEDVPDGNILGGCGKLILEGNVLQIPEAPATAEMFAYYGAVLLKDGDSVVHTAGVDLPVCSMHIGSEYAKEYLLVAEYGGGAYLETHDRPHLHMPCNEGAAGYMILGRRTSEADGSFELSAYHIPYGYALYTPPEVVHCDAFLKGDYMCVYSCTKNYSTYLIRDTNNACVDVQIVPARD